MSIVFTLERREILGGVTVIQGVFDVSPQEYFNEDTQYRSGSRTIKQEIIWKDLMDAVCHTLFHSEKKLHVKIKDNIIVSDTLCLSEITYYNM